MTATAIAAHIAENLRQYTLLAGRIPGGSVCDSPALTWADTGTGAMNRVLAASFPAAAADRRVGEVTAAFAGRPLTWITGPADRPADLGRRLVNLGFRHLMPWRGMARVMDGSPPAAPKPAGLDIVQARDREGVRLWGETAAAGFAMPPAIAADFPAVFSAVDPDRIVYLLGLVGGVPVATASLFHHDVAGAYFISTLPPFRGRGIARALTAALLAHAHARGHRLVVLEASPGGYEVYRRLGFEEYCPMDAYIINA